MGNLSKRYINRRRRVLVDAGFEKISVQSSRRVLIWYFWLLRQLRVENKMRNSEIARALNLSESVVSKDMYKYEIPELNQIL